MADWTRAEVTRTEVHYEVPTREPWGACWNQVLQALEAARLEYFRTYSKPPADDAIRVHVTDDSILIVFEETSAKKQFPELKDLPLYGAPASYPKRGEQE